MDIESQPLMGEKKLAKKEKKIRDEDNLDDEPFCCLGMQVFGWVLLACVIIILIFFLIFGAPK